MATGEYKLIFNEAASTTAMSASQRTVAERGKFNTDVKLRSVQFLSHSNATIQYRAVVYDATSLAVVAKGTLSPSTALTAQTWYEAHFDSGVLLTANTNYYIGVYLSSACIGLTSNSTQRTIASTPAYTTWTDWDTYLYYATSDGVPGAQSGTESHMRFTFDYPIETTITWPTTQFEPRDEQTFSWNISSGTQAQYEVGYRVAGSGGAFTTATSTTANKFHTYPANTFTISQSYEWRVRAMVGGYWTAYATATLLAEPPWIVGPEITSATASGLIPANQVKNPTVEIDASDWESNTIFGTYVQGTIARSTLRAKSGTASAELTYPNGTSWICTHVEGLTIGETYKFGGWVYAPAGTPDVSLNIAFYATGSTITAKDQWVYSEIIHTAASDHVFFGYQGNTPGTAGQKMYVDDFSVTNITTPGAYEYQVRTADTAGFGAWSTSSQFTVNPLSNVKVMQGGSFVFGLKKIRQGGVWVDVLPTQLRSGGTWD